MAYSSLAVANAFIKRSLDKPCSLHGLTPLKLQKLMYYAQAWYFRQECEPLLDDYFCRWEHGPVIPSIYHDFKGFGSNIITALGQNAAVHGDQISLRQPIIRHNDEKAWSYIDAVIEKYGAFDAWTLRNMTHDPQGAWAKDSQGGDGSPILNKDLILDTKLHLA